MFHFVQDFQKIITNFISKIIIFCVFNISVKKGRTNETNFKKITHPPSPTPTWIAFYLTHRFKFSRINLIFKKICMHIISRMAEIIIFHMYLISPIVSQICEIVKFNTGSSQIKITLFFIFYIDSFCSIVM